MPTGQSGLAGDSVPGALSPAAKAMGPVPGQVAGPFRPFVSWVFSKSNEDGGGTKVRGLPKITSPGWDIT